MPAQLVRQKSDSSLDSKAQRSWTKRQITRLEQVLNVLQSGQQKLLNALEQQNLTLFKTTIETEDVKINEPLRKHSQTTALSYAATNVSFASTISAKILLYSLINSSLCLHYLQYLKIHRRMTKQKRSMLCFRFYVLFSNFVVLKAFLFVLGNARIC